MSEKKYFASPTFNSFAKIAMEKNWIAPEMVKVASKLTPTDNLDENYASLIKNLKKRGFESRAKILEDKFFAFKKAELAVSHLIDNHVMTFLNSAHPEGNTRVGDGEFHTGLSTQEEFLKVMNKEAKVTRRLLLKTAKALGLVSFGQEQPEQPEQSDELSPMEQLQYELSDEQKAKIIEVNKGLEEASAGLTAKLEQLSTIRQNLVSADWFNIMGSDLALTYAKNAKIDAKFLSGISSFKAAKEFFGEVSADAIINKLAAPEIIFSVSSILPKQFKQYLTGVAAYYGGHEFAEQGHEKFLTDFLQKAVAQHNLTWNVASIVRANVDKSSNITLEINKSQLNGVISQIIAYYAAIIQIFNAAIGSFIVKGVAAATAPLANIPKGKVIAFSAPVVQEWVGYGDLVKSSWSSVMSLEKGVVFTELNIWFQEMTSLVNSTIQFVKSNQIDEVLDKPLDKDTVEAHSKMHENIKNWSSWLHDNKKTLKADEIKAYNKYIRTLDKINNAVQTAKSKGLPVGSVLMQLKQQNIDFDDEVELYKYIEDENEKAIKAFKQSSIKQELIKEAEKPGSAPGIPTSPSKPAPGATYTPSAPKATSSQAVQRMQLSLVNLGVFLNKNQGKIKEYASDGDVSDINKLLSVGPQTTDPTRMDGVWGPNTAGAVATANKYMKGQNLSLMAIGPFQDEKLANDNAAANQKALSQLNGKFGIAGEDSSGTEVLDKVPVGLPIEMAAPEGVEMVGDNLGTINMTVADLRSLKTFNDFLGEKAQVPFEGKGGYSLAKWREIMNWFQLRINFRLANVKSIEGKNKLSIYRQLMKNISTQLVSIYRQYKADFDANPNLVIDGVTLERLYKATLPGKAGPGENLSDKSTRMSLFPERRGPGRGGLEGEIYDLGEEGLEEGATPTTNVPIQRTINLSATSPAPENEPWWDTDKLGYRGIVSIKNGGTFKYNAKVNAEAMFPDESMDEQESQRAWLEKAGLQGKWDEGTQNYYVFYPPGSKLYTPVTTIPEYRKNQQFHSSSLTKYSLFLVELRNEISRNYRKMLDMQLPEQVLIDAARAQREWVTYIDRHLQQVVDYRKR